MNLLIIADKLWSREIIRLSSRVGPPLSYRTVPIQPYILKGCAWPSPYRVGPVQFATTNLNIHNHSKKKLLTVDLLIWADLTISGCAAKHNSNF